MKNQYARMTKEELIEALQSLERNASNPPPPETAVSYDRLLHDLTVHQEELETQNQSLREAQKLLEESRSRYAELYDLAPVGYVTLDAQGLIREINLTGSTLLGIERSRLIGHPFAQYVASEDRTRFREHVRQCQAEAGSASTELQLSRPDASLFPVELHSVPMTQPAGSVTGCLTALIDITERKRLEQAAQESEALFRAIFSGAGIGIAVANAAGRFLQTNTALQAMFGYSATELSSMTFGTVTHPEYLAADRDLYAELFAGKRDTYQIEKRYRRKDGQLLWGRLTVSLIRGSQGEPLFAIRLLEDITQQKAAAANIERLNRDLERRAAELAAANQELESFAYSVSHDLRAPLASIKGFSHEVLQDYAAQLPSEGTRFLTLIHENAVGMDRLIDDLLTFSRASQQPLKKQAVATVDLVRDVVAKLRSSQPDRPIEIVIGELPPCQADPMLLTQIWVNLLSNAFKFTSKRAQARIEIGSFDEDNATAYYVKDNGVGFNMDQAGRLFGVFQRLHSEEDYPGTGVGLAIVDRIVRRHGGHVWAEGEEGRGATISFTLGDGAGCSNGLG